MERANGRLIFVINRLFYFITSRPDNRADHNESATPSYSIPELPRDNFQLDGPLISRARNSGKRTVGEFAMPTALRWQKPRKDPGLFTVC